ncbi:hypothetical protein GCM10011344_05650 [Dokdonia pacifica]|uniref:Ubiquinone/menaquinone biosynthesis C-methylase UbiE n=1 Tax=Dokdonia pacifica TaxID=1627892 RepID=A0A238ZRK8_9FLAO|nr:class I SAM-dependent methyltransferase [Dokdonia pacifica]GGG07934.1 hypothetical protein GCM10011344_05650 [Dokdonia pacifica]SNR85578.1 Ubiquinone/menaquinone biosynthesis C-methylase UbiE [Dokdonia pacifica]
MKATYDTIGTTYNLTRKADPYLTERLIYHLQPQVHNLYLDIGCGSGNYTHQLQRRGFTCIGIDPSTTMLEKAKQKNASIDWRMGTAENTGLPTESIQGVTAFLTIHHWTDITQGMKELSRVLQKKGRIVIFTSTPLQMKNYWLHHYFPKMLADSITQMPTLTSITKAMKNAGIEIVTTAPYFIQPDLQDQFLYCGKHDPTLYFNQHIRNGISSFSSLANKEEVLQGLKNLKKDIRHTYIDNIISSYKNNLGDYLFIVGRKK